MLFIPMTQDALTIFVCLFLELTGVNKLLLSKLRKTGTAFRLTDLNEADVLSVFKAKLKTFLKDFD